MSHSITLLDGAMGTSLWEKTADKLPVWRYNMLSPDLVKQVHEDMIASGAEVILSNTFGANGPEVVRRTQYTVEQAVREGMAIAKDAAKGKARVLLDMGPLTGLMEPYGDIEEDECEEIYLEMLQVGVQEQPDGIFLETFIDLNMLSVAARCAAKFDLPLYLSMSFEKVGKTMMGNSVRDMVEALSALHPAAVGLNCSMGPDLCLPVLKSFREYTDLPLIFKPNAGLPVMVNGKAVSPYTPDMFRQDMVPALSVASFVGGCCGTTCEHIRALREAVREMQP